MKSYGLLFEQAASVPTVQELRPWFERELRRARRYERPLTVLVLALEPAIMPGGAPSTAPGAGSLNGTADPARSNGNGRNGNGGNGSAHGVHVPDPGSLNELYSAQLRLVQLAALLRDTLRESDLVGFAAETQDFVAVLPEADAASAEQLAQRIHRLFVSRIGTGIQAGSAAYPATGLTLAALVDRARGALHPHPIPLQRPAIVERERSHA